MGVRWNHWKITKRGPRSDWKLYNLREDISEMNDISHDHPELVKMMVKQAYHWSKTHTTPLWFDNKQAETYWHNNEMPKYNSTFQEVLGSP